jgi:AbrB family transcriptional regulator (stage V sporulation protein T)
MQDTGIVRRIDELGRVVIPKELRKTLRIREGDPLEIYTNKDELIFKKYSPISAINSYAEAVADGIEEVTEKTCMITDNDTVLYVSGKNKEVIGKDISSDLEKVLKERKSLVLSRSESGNLVSIIKGEEIIAENQIIVPIVSVSGDCYGSVLVIDNDKNVKFSSTDVRFAKLGASFLSKQFD